MPHSSCPVNPLIQFLRPTTRVPITQEKPTFFTYTIVNDVNNRRDRIQSCSMKSSRFTQVCAWHHLAAQCSHNARRLLELKRTCFCPGYAKRCLGCLTNHTVQLSTGYSRIDRLSRARHVCVYCRRQQYTHSACTCNTVLDFLLAMYGYSSTADQAVRQGM